MRKTYLLLALAAAATSAHAATYGGSASVVGAGGVSWTAALPADGADFSDTFSFTLGAGSGTATRFSASFFDLAALNNDPSYGVLSLPQITFTLNGIDKALVATQVAPGTQGTAQAAVSFTGLTAGTAYTLTVFGKGLGDNAGSGSYYLGKNYVINVAAVPEPETYAMLVAGLGLLGVVARRRRTGAA